MVVEATSWTVRHAAETLNQHLGKGCEWSDPGCRRVSGFSTAVSKFRLSFPRWSVQFRPAASPVYVDHRRNWTLERGFRSVAAQLTSGITSRVECWPSEGTAFMLARSIPGRTKRGSLEDRCRYVLYRLEHLD
jgi:hypothetical protein